MKDRRRHDLILSVHFLSRGFAFVLVEGRGNPVDWGIAEIRGEARNARCFERLVDLIARFRPDVIVLEEVTEEAAHRSRRIVALDASVMFYLTGLNMPVWRCRRSDVAAVFAHLQHPTKDAIAAAIGEAIPVLARYVPPPRKPWMSADVRMGLFDAMAMALAFHHVHDRRD